jgi:hypothetical protein
MKTLQDNTTAEQYQYYLEYYAEIAQASVRIAIVKNDLFVYGSEKACLRIGYRHRQENNEVLYAGEKEGWFFVSRDHHKSPLLYAVESLEVRLDTALNHTLEAVAIPDKIKMQRILESCARIVNELSTFPF